MTSVADLGCGIGGDALGLAGLGIRVHAVDADEVTAAIAAFRANQQPAIVQVFEVGTGTMMAAQGAIVPVHELMEQHGQAFDQAAFLPAVVGYYTDPNGNMLSFPFNSSTPILYYNKDIFEKAGLDPEQPPVTTATLPCTRPVMLVLLLSVVSAGRSVVIRR